MGEKVRPTIIAQTEEGCRFLFYVCLYNKNKAIEEKNKWRGEEEESQCGSVGEY